MACENQQGDAERDAAAGSAVRTGDGFWRPRCSEPGRPCGGAAFTVGERCTWCGLGEDGSRD